MKTLVIFGRSFTLQSILGWLGLVLLTGTRFIDNNWLEWTVIVMAMILLGYALWLEEIKS